MKLNYKRTFLVGFAFLSICAFWQLYDNIIPLILLNTFKLTSGTSGYIMAADNVLAMFLLPFFGSLSDKCKSRLGRRMPFIIGGTFAAVILMNTLPLLDNAYFSSGGKFLFIAFICVLGALLVAMGLYRSPAVALMPDVTPKPLRSKANAVINLMGAIGGIIYLFLTTFMYSSAKTSGLEHVDYSPIFIIISAIMAFSVVLLSLTVKEKKITDELAALEEEDEPQPAEAASDDDVHEKMKPEVRRSLIFLLCSISLWFIGYNAVSTWFSTFATTAWNMSLGAANLCLTIATGGAILSYIPVGIISSKIGRKKTIIGGTVLLASCFGASFLFTLFSDKFSPVLYLVFAVVGLAWASINVNSLPMVVEMCSSRDIGKFTGYYYTFSMAAQIVTPILSGILMEKVSTLVLFPYSALFVLASTVTMLFVMHGDSRPEVPKDKLEMIGGADD